MEKNNISAQQFAIMIFVMLIGSSLVYLTGAAAAQNAWLANLIGPIFGLYVLYVVIKIHEMFPGQRITQISTAVLGKIPGTVLNCLFLWSIFSILTSFFMDINMLMQIIYPLLSDVILYSLLIFSCCYCLYKGMTVQGRLGELIVVIVIFISIIGTLLSLPVADFSNLKPFLENWRPLVAGTLYAADWPFDEVVIFGLFLPMVSGLKQNKSKIYRWYFGAAILLVALDLVILTVLGSLSKFSLFPLYSASRLVGFENFQRVELLFFVLWFFAGIYTNLVFFQGLNFIVQDLFTLKSHKALIIPLGFCTLVFTLYMFPNTIEYNLMGFKYLPVFTFPFNLLYPTIILCAAKFKQKHQPQNSSKTNSLQQRSAS